MLFVDLIGSTALAAEAAATTRSSSCSTGSSPSSSRSSIAHGGWVNKFEGDAALVRLRRARSRATTRRPRARRRAASCRRGSRASVPELDAARSGSSAGPAVAGNVGAGAALRVHGDRRPGQRGLAAVRLAKHRPERVVASASILGRAQSAESARWSPDGEVVLRGRTTRARLAIPA